MEFFAIKPVVWNAHGYKRPGGATFDFMPQVYLLDVAILSLVLYLSIKSLQTIVASKISYKYGLLLSCVGLTTTVLAVIFLSFQVWVGILHPRLSIGDDRFGRYLDFRPQRLVWSGQQDCAPAH